MRNATHREAIRETAWWIREAAYKTGQAVQRMKATSDVSNEPELLRDEMEAQAVMDRLLAIPDVVGYEIPPFDHHLFRP